MENFIFCAVFRISFGALLSNAYLPKSLQIGQNLKICFQFNGYSTKFVINKNWYWREILDLVLI